jgi:Tfp pilus assembly protein PilV
MRFMRAKPSIRPKEAGLTLIEMLVVAPLVILLIGVSLGYISSLTGQGLQTRQKNLLAYTTQASLDDIEVNANQATSFLPQTTGVVSPQGRNNSGTQFVANSGGSGGTLIIKSAATTKNPYDPTRALIYTGTGSGCNENNTILTYTTVYFIASNQLFKRTILPNVAACAVPYQLNSCASASMSSTICKVEDEKLADNVSDFSISYFSDNAAATPDNADTILVSLTLSQPTAGQTITYTGTVRTITSNLKADVGQAPDKPQASGSVNPTSSDGPDIFTCSWEPTGNATGYNVRYRYNTEAWINGPQNTTATSYQININSNRNKTITCEVTAVTPSGNVVYDPVSYDIPLWTNCLLENGWVNYGSGHAAAQFYKSPSNVVTIKGLVRNGTVTNGTRICQLPEGYRPDSRLIFQVAENGSTAGRIDVTPDGQILVVAADTGWTNLSTISFPTADASWTSLTGSNGWVNYGSPYSNVKVTKDGNGKAYLQGLSRNGTATSGTLGYTLPSGYASDNNLFPTLAGGNTASALGVQGSGIYARAGANSYWSLQASFHTVAGTTWTAPTLQNSWVNYGSGWTGAGYTKSPDGIVALQGLIRSGTVTSGTTIATLPSGYRPSETIICDVVTNPNTYARIDVLSTGAIITREAVTNGFLSLAGCEFMADGS